MREREREREKEKKVSLRLLEKFLNVLYLVEKECSNFFLFLVNLNIEKLFSLEIHVEKDMF